MLERPTHRIRGREGFTLIELMTVVIIINILASLALPRFDKVVERARQAEALSNLGSLRSAEFRWYAEYTEITNDLGRLDIESPNELPEAYFTYSITPGVGADFVITARRNTWRLPAGVDPYDITINQDGVITSTF